MTARLFFHALLWAAAALALAGCADHYTLGAEYSPPLDQRRQTTLTIKGSMTFDTPRHSKE